MNRRLILQLTGRHEILRTQPKLIAVASISGVLVMNVLAFNAAKSDRALEPGMLDFFLVQAALPLTAQQVWRSHNLALMLGGLVSILMTAVVVAVVNFLMSATTNLALLQWSHLSEILVRPALLVLVISGLVSIRRTDLIDLTDDPGWPRLRLRLLALLLGLLIVLQFLPLATGAVPVMVISVLVGRARNDLSNSMEALPVGSEAGSPYHPTGAAMPVAASSRPLNFTIMRQLFKWPLNWIVGMPFLVLFGFLLGGFLPGLDPGRFDDNSMRVVQYFIAVYLLLAFGGHFLENMWRVDHLPISRRRLLVWLMVPNMIALSLGYGGSMLLLQRHYDQNEQLRFVNEGERYGLKVPLEFFELAAADAPLIVAPDGSEVEPFSRSVMKGLPWQFYQPYHTPIDAGPDFIAWQIHRAVQAVYGVEISPDEIRQRYLEVPEEGPVEVVEAGLTLQADYPELHNGYRGPVFPILVGSILILFILAQGVIFSFYRPGITYKRGRVVFWGMMGFLFLLHVCVYATLIAGWTDDWILTGSVLGLARMVLDAGPFAQVGVWFLTALIFAASWRWTERRFHDVEAPRGGGSCSFL